MVFTCPETDVYTLHATPSPIQTTTAYVNTHTNNNVEINSMVYETSVQVTCLVHMHMDMVRGVTPKIWLATPGAPSAKVRMW